MIAQSFLSKLREKHDVNDAVFLVDNSTSLQSACKRTGSISDMKNMEIGILLNVSFER
jgi:transposase-like protein